MVVKWMKLAIAAVITAAAWPAEAKREPTPEEAEIIKAGVRGALKDPDSARFGKIVVSTATVKDPMACGLVNAKNSFGGYAGMTPFFGMYYTTPSGSYFLPISDISGDKSKVKVTFEMCKKEGAPL